MPLVALRAWCRALAVLSVSVAAPCPCPCPSVPVPDAIPEWSTSRAVQRAGA